MKIFRLHPKENKMDDVNWQASTSKKPMVVRAVDENRARRIAALVCGIAVERGNPSQITPVNPWSKVMQLGDCVELEQYSYPLEGEEEILEPEYLNDELNRKKL